MAEDRVDIKFGAQIGELTAGVDAVRAKIESVTGPVNDLAASFGNLGSAIVAGLGIDRVVAFTREIVALGEEALHASETLGISVPVLSALNAAFDIAGVGADRAQMAMLRLERAASELLTGTGPLADTFKRLGISATDMGGHLKSGEELLKELADRIKDAPRDVNRLDAAWQIFGRGLGNDLIPFLERGSAGIDDLIEKARATGTVIDTSLAREMEQATEKGRTLREAIKGLGIAIEAEFHFFKDFADAWTAIAESMTRALGVTDQAKLDNVFAQLTRLHEKLMALKAIDTSQLTAPARQIVEGEIAAIAIEIAQLNEQRKRLIADMKADAASGGGRAPIRSGRQPI